MIAKCVRSSKTIGETNVTLPIRQTTSAMGSAGAIYLVSRRPSVDPRLFAVPLSRGNQPPVQENSNRHSTVPFNTAPAVTQAPVL